MARLFGLDTGQSAIVANEGALVRRLCEGEYAIRVTRLNDC